MNADRCRQRLGELLRAQNERITRASEYLRVIRQAIADDQMESLQQSLSSPDLPLEDIEHLEQRRYQLLTDFGFDRNSDGLEACIDWCDRDQQLAKLYQQLVANLMDLRQSIQINSLLVNRGRDRVRRSIGILTGVGDAGTGKTYSDQGRAIDPAARRNIAIA